MTTCQRGRWHKALRDACFRSPGAVCQSKADDGLCQIDKWDQPQQFIAPSDNNRSMAGIVPGSPSVLGVSLFVLFAVVCPVQFTRANTKKYQHRTLQKHYKKCQEVGSFYVPGTWYLRTRTFPEHFHRRTINKRITRNHGRFCRKDTSYQVHLVRVYESVPNETCASSHKRQQHNNTCPSPSGQRFRRALVSQPGLLEKYD